MSNSSLKKWRIDPFEIAIFLTLLVLMGATVWTEATFMENLMIWGGGLWNLTSFMTQMSLILVGGYVIALSKPVEKGLHFLAGLPENDKQAYILCLFVSAVACWCNWGLGLVVGAFFAKALILRRPSLNFPLLVSISYMGFIFWHAGLSGSIPLTVGTPGNFSEPWMRKTLSLSETIFSWHNISLIFVLFGALSCLIVFVFAKQKYPEVRFSETFENESLPTASTHLFSKLMLWCLIVMILVFFVIRIGQGSFQFGLNQVNLLLILFSLLVYRDLKLYLMAASKACSKLAPILIQYPLYSGIMAIMIESGLAAQISQAFVDRSTESTYPLLMFLSAGWVNFFVPSGGGQWAVQAPIVIDGARQLGVGMGRAVMAVAWGDAWTNLAQPFWALPLLAIAGLGLKDILSYCLTALVVSGGVISFWFLVF